MRKKLAEPDSPYAYLWTSGTKLVSSSHDAPIVGRHTLATSNGHANACRCMGQRSAEINYNSSRFVPGFPRIGAKMNAIPASSSMECPTPAYHPSYVLWHSTGTFPHTLSKHSAEELRRALAYQLGTSKIVGIWRRCPCFVDSYYRVCSAHSNFCGDASHKQILFTPIMCVTLDH